MANTPLDLSQLALDRSPREDATPTKPRRKRWFTRYVLPIGILCGFVALLAAAAGRGLMPRPSVTVVPVVVKRAEVQQAGTTLFQAPGWIEPRPTAISVAALAPGVIEELLVVAGQHVKKDEAIAKLISIDAELNVQQAKNLLAIRQGELKRAIAERDAAQIRFDNPVHLQVQLADAQSMLAKAQTELAKLPFLIQAAEAHLDYTKSSMEGKRSAKGAISGNIIARAESDHAASLATLQELRQRGPNLQRESDALDKKVTALKRQLELLVEETRQLHEADAKVQSAEALRDEAELQLRQAELALRRNVVRAPMDGRVLRLVAAPGTRVMGLASNASHSSSTVIEMYDPDRLQVRADVRLEDVPMVTRGQPVQIETASSEDVIQGRVLQLTSSANIQKNTLEVKVELIQPPPTVSPEMLVTATFLAPTIANSKNETTESERMFVPSRLVQSGDAGAFIWVVDADDIARQRPVELGGSSGDGLVEIKSGLNVTDKLITSGLEGLKQDSTVRVAGDDQNMGIN
ncbi:Multidrug resistance protein MdtA precursor [Stieleria neptunia]|uniref:Multidrug resistance protein MdtA n=1 Tax=Stieleria neptunia TaxID=2527979 RepID=A0A518HJI3_9BACT|nr:efflux RND transporter periplasmic adaptor subunit [Stieleria neptunia]QDV41008.1 Multidrug resistance protein MdtA precursor [Stieleria neptunia]